VPPVRATMLGLVLGLIPWTHDLLLSKSDDERAPLDWLVAGISKLGDAAVPLNLITLGASLAKGPDFNSISVKSCAAIVVAKLILMPVVAMLAVMAVNAFFPVNILHPFQQPFYLTAMVVASTPTANNVLIMCTIAGQDRTAMSTAIFVQYACSPIILTLTICGFVAIMVDSEMM
jgi:predicted permease